MRKVWGWILIAVGVLWLVGYLYGHWLLYGFGFDFGSDLEALSSFLLLGGLIVTGVWLIRKKRKLYAKLITKNGNRRVGPFRSREELELWYNRVDDWKDVERIDVVRG